MPDFTEINHHQFNYGKVRFSFNDIQSKIIFCLIVFYDWIFHENVRFLKPPAPTDRTV